MAEESEAPAMTNPPRSLTLALKGIRTVSDFTRVMSSLMTDLLEGRVPHQIGNAVTNAGGKMLKAVELQEKYGTKGPNGADRSLVLADLSLAPPSLEGPAVTH